MEEVEFEEGECKGMVSLMTVEQLYKSLWLGGQLSIALAEGASGAHCWGMYP